MAFAVNTFCQTITSVADGNWYMPTTWSCTCIPLGTDTVIINHKVILDNDFLIAGGSVTIGVSGSLTENANNRYFAMNSGTFTNGGLFNVGRVAMNGGNFINNDSCIINSQFYSASKAINNSVITGVDSLLIAKKFVNNSSAILEADKLLNNDSLVNKGILTVTDLSNFLFFKNKHNAEFVNFYNAGFGQNEGDIIFNDFSNSGQYLNFGTMHGSANATNFNYLYIDTLGQLLVQHDFSNLDSAGSEAFILLQGLLHVADNFYNEDTITGTTGNICVGQLSTNNGAMMGSWDFCGLTSSGGHVTLNNGYISPAITYCTKSCAAPVAEIQEKSAVLSVYPNPSNSIVNFEFDIPQENAIFILSDITGRLVFTEQNIKGSKYMFEGSQLPSGIYIYNIEISNKSFRGKLLID